MLHSEDELEGFLRRAELVLVDVADGGAKVQVSHCVEGGGVLFVEVWGEA